MTQPANSGISTDTGASSVDRAAVLSRNDRWLRTVVLSRVGEPQAVDEVLQEVALAAVAQPVAPIRWAPWLYRLAVRQALLYRRKQGRERRRVDRYADEVRNSPCSSEYDPLKLLLAAEKRGRIRDAVAGLPRRDADILLLKYTEDWSYRELAEHLGLTESAVEARLHRARRRLRSELARLQVIEVKP